MKHPAVGTVCLMLSLVCVAPSAAQERPQYRFGRDTLRYDEQMYATLTLHAPQGVGRVTSLHTARLSLVAYASGVRAWYDALDVAQQMAGLGQQRAATARVLRQPFSLTVSDRGVVRTVQAPAVPADVGLISDLTRQFDDFLITLPAQALRTGVVWSDTIVSTRGARADSTITVRHVRSYRVEADTVVDGIAAVRIAVRQRLDMKSQLPVPDGGGMGQTDLAGDETGVAIFAPARGVLLSRERAGTLTGMLRITSGSQVKDYPQRVEYSSYLRLIK